MTSGLRLRRVPLDEVPWAVLDSRPSRTVYQTREWLEFLAVSQGAEPVAAEVVDGPDRVGWFSGAVVRRFGLRILGSPLPGWSTSYMGFTMEAPGHSDALLQAFADFAFGDLRCVHFEIMDRLTAVKTSDLPRRAKVSQFHSYELKLRDDETLLAGMSQNARRNIRRAQAEGVVVEEVGPNEASSFAREFYAQVSQSFAKNDLAPTFPVSRVQQLIELLHPTGLLLVVRARTADGDSAATGIFPGVPGSSATFWMGASDPRHLKVRPNEALMWHGLKWWRDRGAETFDFGGGGTYKEKYGGQPIEVDWLRWSRYPGLERVREVIRRATRARQTLRSPNRPQT